LSWFFFLELYKIAMVKVLISSNPNYSINKQNIKQKVKRVLQKHDIDDAEVGIFFVGSKEISQLNKRFMKREGTTDVLSFPMTGGDKVEFVEPDQAKKRLYLGDIFVCCPQAKRQAKKYNLSVSEEIDKLVEHGILHLLGIHHSK